MQLKEVLQRYVDDMLPEFNGITLIDVNQTGNCGNTPLHVACTRGNLEEVDALIVGGSNLNAKGEDGFTPMHRAAAQGHVAVVKRLLDAGASPNIVNDDGRTALEVAALLERCDVIATFEDWLQLEGSG
jgi:ankyrin repeat protein